MEKDRREEGWFRKVLNYKSAEMFFNLSKCCIFGPQVELNLSGCQGCQAKTKIFSNFKKNIKSSPTVELGDRGDLQSIRILLHARRSPKAIGLKV